MATYQELAQALQNAHRAGDTAAAQKLAQALKGMQAQQQTQPQQQNQPTSNVFSGMASRGLGILEGAVKLPQTITEAVTGVKDPRIVFGNDQPGFQLGDLKPTVMTAAEADAAGTYNPFGFTGNEFKNAAKALEDAQVNINYQPSVPWNQVKQQPNASNIATFIGETALTSLPDMAAALVSFPLYWSSYIAPIAEERAKNDGNRDVTPGDLIVAFTAAGGLAAAERFGAKGVIGDAAAGSNAAGRITGATAKEAGTEAIQNPAEYAAGTLGTETGFDPATALDQAAAGVVGGGGTGATLRTGIETVSGAAKVIGADNQVTDPEAAADLANRLKTIATANNYDLNDVSKTSSKGARETVDKAHVQIAEDIKQLSADLRTRLNVKDTDELSVVLDKVLAAAGKRQSKNKTKNTVGQQELDAIERLTGNTAEGQSLLSLMRQSNELTELHNSGYVGGVSKYTDMLNPIRTDVGYSSTSAVEIPTRIAGTLYGATINPLIPAAQAATLGAGRLIDKVTGNRSNVGKFVNQNQGNQGIQKQTAPSLREQAQRADLEKQLQAENDALEQQLSQQEALSRRRAAYLNQDLPAAGSPEATMVIATEGVDQKTLEQVVDYIGQARPELKDSADAYLAAIRGETLSDVPGLTELIRAVKTFVDNTPQFANKKNPQLAARISENFTTPVAAAGGVPGYMNTPNYQRGIADNQAAADSLTEAVNNDSSISAPDKAKLLDGLAQLRSNLGVNPAEKAVDIYNSTKDKLTDKALADTYMMPYVERVAGQQPNQESAISTTQEEQAPVASPDASNYAVGDEIQVYLPNGVLETVTVVDKSESGTVLVESKNGKESILNSDEYSTTNPMEADFQIETVQGTPKLSDLSTEQLNAISSDLDRKITAASNNNDVKYSFIREKNAIHAELKRRNSNVGEGTMENMAAPAIGEGLSIFPKTQKLYKMIDGLEVDQGNYVNTADGSDVTGKSYDGARIYIKPNGKPAMEVDQNEVSTPTKEFGLRWYSNAVRPDRYKFVDNPTNHQGSIVTVEGRTSTSSDNKQKHYFALQYASDVPVELHRRKGGEPTLRPQGFGIVKPGNQIGTISMSGRESPLYDEIRIEPVNPQTSIQKIDAPLSYEMDPFGIGNDVLMTSVDIMPTDEELAQMKAGTYKPVKKQSKEAAYGNYHQDKWVPVAGQEEMLEYTPENVDRIAKMIATEALPAIRRDDSAIGWYDAKLKAAKAVMRIVEPRIEGNEAPFDYVLALTSNGTAVTDNFQYALEAFRYYLDNGEMPTKWDKGGERASAIRAGFDFFNAYQENVTDLPLAEFLDKDFRRSDLSQWAEGFNKRFGTELSVGVQENADAMVKGSYVLGAKIGQGFYQNIRGNYDPLTMDIWWMRMWNRMVGRPFEPPKTEADMQKNRNKIKRGMIDNKDKDMRKVINQALKNAGETRQGLYGDKERFDKFITALHKEYQKYYKAYKKKNGVNHVKPQLFKTVGTHFLNMGDQLKATPAGGSERAYMRQVVDRTRELLKQRNYDINTADFQALMWYPEKQLARKMGVAPGKGEDNDYLDAAIIAAKKEGVNDEQIKEALPDTERERLFGGADSQGADGASNQGTSGAVQEIRDGNAIDEQSSGSFRRSYQSIPAFGSRTVEPVQIRDQLELAEQLFAEGKPLPIGMPGTPFENGIQDVRVVELLAKSLGYGFEIFANPNQYKKGMKIRFDRYTSGKALGGLFSNADPTKMVFDRVENKPLRGFLAARSTYQNKKDKKDYITLPLFIFAALHELGHAIERLPFVDSQQISATQTQTNPRPSNMILGLMNTPDGSMLYTDGRVRNNTFRGYLAHLVNAFGNKITAPKNIKSDLDFTDAELENIVSEVLDLQRTGMLTIQGVGQVMPRPTYSDTQYAVQQGDATMYEANEFIKQEERTYFHKPQELAADMIGSYLLDPAGFKQKAPTAAKFVRDLLNTANAESSKFVKFYSAPLAMVVATIMAQLMLGEQEEEDKKGALSLGQAALTA